MERKDNRLIFDNDADFEAFAIDPDVKIHRGNGIYWYDWDYTTSYKKEVENGTLFVMRDPKSCILKRGCLTHHSVSRPVEVCAIADVEE